MKTRSPWLQKNRLEIAIFLLVLFLSAYTLPRWADPNQNSRLDMVFAVVEQGSFQIDAYVENTVDYAKWDGHYYSDKPPGTAFLGIPIYSGLRFVLNTPALDAVVEKLANSPSFQATLREGGSGVYAEKVRFALAQVVLAFLLAAVPTALTSVMIYRLSLLWRLSASISAFTALAYAVLTPVFAYSNALYGHQLSAALLLGAFSLAVRQAPLRGRDAFWAGLFLAYAVITEYPTVLAAGIIGLVILFGLVRHKAWGGVVTMLIPALAVLALLLWYNNAVFGSPFRLGYSYSENWTEQHETGFMSLTAPTLTAMWGITFGVFRGLFLLSPLLLCAIPGFVLWLRRPGARVAGVTALAITVAMFLFNSSSIMWWGGFAVGPRYLLAALPFLTLAAGFVFAQLVRGWLGKVLLALLAAVSLVSSWGMALAGQSYPPDTIPNPFSGWLVPHWTGGNIARNLGTLAGLPGFNSLLPLVAVLVVGTFVILGWARQEVSGEI